MDTETKIAKLEAEYDRLKAKIAESVGDEQKLLVRKKGEVTRQIDDLRKTLPKTPRK